MYCSGSRVLCFLCVPVHADLMREESAQSVHSLVERSFPAHRFPRLIVLGLTGYHHFSHRGPGPRWDGKNNSALVKTMSTGVRAQRLKKSKKRWGSRNCGHNETNAHYWQIISQMSFLFLVFKVCMTEDEMHYNYNSTVAFQWTSVPFYQKVAGGVHLPLQVTNKLGHGNNVQNKSTANWQRKKSKVQRHSHKCLLWCDHITANRPVC